jgi:hypothetical protein
MGSVSIDAPRPHIDLVQDMDDRLGFGPKPHKERIEDDMVSTQKENQMKKLNQDNIKVKVVETDDGLVTTTRKKRNELSKSVMKNMNKQDGCRILQFD